MSRQVIFSFLVGTQVLFGAVSGGELSGRVLPMTCSELLPDLTPYIGFLDSVGKSQVTQDRRFAKKIYRIMALREKINELGEQSRENNPIDILIRKTLCFYREQKEPLKPVAFDDEKFLQFMKSSINELEMKVEQAVFDVELARQERKEFERRAMKNQKIVDTLLREADIEAETQFQKLAIRAKKKAQSQ